jgi:hypothetical protein
VNPINVPIDAFRDWDTLENKYIKAPTGINKNHVFTVDINRNNGNSMFLQPSLNGPERELHLVLEEFHDNGTEFWKELQPELIPPVGIQDIKWNELYKKWGSLSHRTRGNNGGITVKLLRRRRWLQ